MCVALPIFGLSFGIICDSTVAYVSVFWYALDIYIFFLIILYIVGFCCLCVIHTSSSKDLIKSCIETTVMFPCPL